MRLQIKNRIFLMEAISYAEITFPGEDTVNDWVELYTIIGGKEIIFTGDEALTVWQAISRNAAGLPTQPDAITCPQVITSDYGTQIR